MIHKKTFLVFFSFLFVFSGYSQQAKYIFYMIGDGMGVNHVNLAEVYGAELESRIGIKSLSFSQFPFSSFATTFSTSNGITDSAAGGTALAVGKKTKNGVIGMNEDGTIPYKSIAYAAQEKGLKVGITTSVSIDHATPASFYANQAKRQMYYEIAQDIIKSNFDFFGGSGFLSPTLSYDKKAAPSIYPQLEKAGYTLVKGNEAYRKVKNKGKKIILTNAEGTDSTSLTFAIDRKAQDMKLADITNAAIESLSLDNKKGFFLMVEGGMIDWSSHSNDGATTIHETYDFNESVKIAYEFYKKHPNETLIVVTADHETGGLSVGNSGYGLNTKELANQKISQGALSTLITDLRKNSPNATYQDVKNLLRENLGLWSTVSVSDEDNKVLQAAYQKSFVDHQEETLKSLYANDDRLASIGIALLNKAASLGWGTNSHSALPVPVFAIGVGAERFNHKMDNTDIPKKIAEAAGLDLK